MKHKIKQWMRKVIAKPREQLNGHAICPFIDQYWNNITVVESNDFAKVADNFAALGKTLGLEAVVVYGFPGDWDQIERKVNNLNRRLRKKDVYCLFMMPDSVEPPLPLNYNFKHLPLVIIQKLSTLQQARQKLAKSKDYYKVYKG